MYAKCTPRVKPASLSASLLHASVILLSAAKTGLIGPHGAIFNLSENVSAICGNLAAGIETEGV
jgi:hypothetical protein